MGDEVVLDIDYGGELLDGYDELDFEEEAKEEQNGHADVEVEEKAVQKVPKTEENTVEKEQTTEEKAVKKVSKTGEIVVKPEPTIVTGDPANRKKTKVQVTSIPPTMSDREFENLFALMGTVTRAYIVRHPVTLLRFNFLYIIEYRKNIYLYIF